MSEERKITKQVSDLGVAAYLLMHRYEVVGRRGKDIFFKIKESESDEFSNRQLEYLSSQYHQFDSCLMSLKKLGDFTQNEKF